MAAKSLFEKLFDTYGDTVLREQGVYDEAEVLAALDELPLDQGSQLEVCDLLSSYYLRWSTAAYTTGLCLGLSLLQPPRGRGPQMPNRLSTMTPARITAPMASAI